jgi:hypothetical protein
VIGSAAIVDLRKLRDAIAGILDGVKNRHPFTLSLGPNPTPAPPLNPNWFLFQDLGSIMLDACVGFLPFRLHSSASHKTRLI